MSKIVKKKVKKNKYEKTRNDGTKGKRYNDPLDSAKEAAGEILKRGQEMIKDNELPKEVAIPETIEESADQIDRIFEEVSQNITDDDTESN